MPPHAPDGLRQVAAAEWVLGAVKGHQSPRTHTSLAQPPSTLTGRLPSILNTSAQGFPHAGQQPIATMGVEDLTAVTLIEHHGLKRYPFRAD